MTTPKLRFTEFKSLGDWETVKLGDISEKVKRITDEKLEVLTISAKRGFITQKDRFSQVIAGDSLKKYIHLKKNEFSYNKGNSKAFKYGCIYLLENYDQALVPNVYKSFKMLNVIPMFYKHLFSMKYLDHQLIKFISSTARMNGLLNINDNDFYSATVPYPTIAEQEKVANFLTLIDKKIKLLEQQEKNLKSYKKTLSTQLLTQAKRFAGFTEDWQTVRLGDISEVKKGKQLNKEYLSSTGPYYVLNGGRNPSGYYNEYNTEKNTISISEGGESCGYVTYNRSNFWAGGHCYILLNLSMDLNSVFVYNYLKFIEIKIMRLRVGSGLPNIQIGSISNLNIKLPPLAEQKRIAHTLQTLDTRITKTHHQLESTNKFKKHLLKNMLT